MTNNQEKSSNFNSESNHLDNENAPKKEKMSARQKVLLQNELRREQLYKKSKRFARGLAVLGAFFFIFPIYYVISKNSSRNQQIRKN